MKTHDETHNAIIQEETGPPALTAATAIPRSLPAPVLDPDKHRHHLAGYGLSPEQEQEVLATLWEIMRTMVDIGLGFDVVSQAIPALLDAPEQADAKTLRDDASHTCNEIDAYLEGLDLSEYETLEERKDNG